MSHPYDVVGMILAVIDRMEESDQMILKSAAVCGIIFDMLMLEAMLPHKFVRNLRHCIKRLVHKNILTCHRNFSVNSFTGQRFNAAAHICHCKVML